MDSSSLGQTFKQYKSWDPIWRRQYLEQLKLAASQMPRQKFIPIQRENDGCLIAYLEVRHPVFPAPGGRYTFTNSSWLSDGSLPHPPITLMAEDYYGTDLPGTVSRSTNVLTGNRYYYDCSESWTITNGDTLADKFWEEMWRMSPQYRQWKETHGSVLNVTLGLKVFLSNEMVKKLRQISLTQTEQTDPAYVPASIDCFDHKIFRDDSTATVAYWSNYSIN